MQEVVDRRNGKIREGCLSVHYGTWDKHDRLRQE